MIDPKRAYTALLDDSRLDDLLTQTKSQIEKLSTGPESPSQATEKLSQTAKVLDHKSAQVRKDLLKLLAEKEEVRVEKVATVIHMVRVASKLLA